MGCELELNKGVRYKSKSKDKRKPEKQDLSHSFLVLLGFGDISKIETGTLNSQCLCEMTLGFLANSTKMKGNEIIPYLIIALQKGQQ